MGKEDEGEESKDGNHLTMFTPGFLGERHQEFSVFLRQLFCNPETASIFFFFFLVRKDFIYENLEQYKTQKLHSGATTSNF